MALTFDYIQNSYIKAGIILEWAGCIGYFSEIDPELNMVDINDAGRLIQQSYYDSNSPYQYWDEEWGWLNYGWGWNPVEGGDINAYFGELITHTNDGTTLYTKSIPKDWWLSNVPIDGYYEKWITLEGRVMKVVFKFTYTGSLYHTPSIGECPAMWLKTTLDRFTGYVGSYPWSNGALTTYYPLPTDANGLLLPVAERWGFLSGSDGFGVGVYNADAVFMHDAPSTYKDTNYKIMRYGGGTSYMCPMLWRGWSQGNTQTYTAYFMIGDDINTMRETFKNYYLDSIPPVAPSVGRVERLPRVGI